MHAYLDIETTGLSPRFNELTVVGVLTSDKSDHFTQLVGPEITAKAVKELLKGVDCLYTFNGKRFDIPFICQRLNITVSHPHVDLMHVCRQHGYVGGLKKIERELGIARQDMAVDGFEAVRLWYAWLKGSHEALKRLKEYNREDVYNLKVLHRYLEKYEK
jgi:uncharacterized protein